MKNSPRNLLRSERGSVSAALLFVMFSAVAMTAIMSMVVSTIAASTSARSYSTASSVLALNKGFGLDTLAYSAKGIAPEGLCLNKACTTLEDITHDEDTTTLKLVGSIGGSPKFSHSETVRKVQGNYVIGMNDSGQPIWSTNEGTEPHSFISVVSQGDFSCAIEPTDPAKPENGGPAWCWGSNVNGQLGNGSTKSSLEPVQVSGNKKFLSLGSGAPFTMCGIQTDNKGACWGNNSHGQAGTAKLGGFLTVPTTIPGGTTFASITQSATTSCGIALTDKRTWCWGENNGDGKVKAAETTPQGTPVLTAGTNTYTALAMDLSTACGLTTAGKIMCWSSTKLGSPGIIHTASAEITPLDPSATLLSTTGQDSFNQIADKPTEINGGGTWLSVASTGDTREHAKPLLCAIRNESRTDRSGDVWCWGSGTSGQLGNGKNLDSPTPVKVSGGKKFAALATSPESVCAAESNGQLWCWGSNSNGQLGNGTTTGSNVPVRVTGGAAFNPATLTAATGNKQWFCAAEKAGGTRCWGRNSFGQADPKDTKPVTSPTAITNIKNVETLSAGDHFVCSTTRQGTVSCWGINTMGQTGQDYRSPAKPSGENFTTAHEVAQKPYTPPSYRGYINGGKK